MSLEKFETVTLADVSINNKGDYGIGASAVDYSDELYTYLRITDINDDGTLNKNDLKSVDDKDAKNYLLKENDVVFARTGNSTGKAYYYDKMDGELVYAGFLIKFSLDPLKINPKFMKYYVLSEEYKGWVNSMCTGSTRPNINAKMYGNMELTLPSRKQQDFLVNILDKFDKKIEINKRINKNLFELSNVIYSDFIKSMDNNEQCHYIELKELGNIVMGQSPKGESYNYDNIGLPLINGAADYENGYLKAQKYTSDPKKTCNKNDLIFCIRATIGLLVVCDKKYCLGRGVAGITNINPIYKEYAFHLINSSIENFKRAATGSVISGISRKDIENIDVIIPSSDEINKYHAVQKPIFDKLENNRIEINNLIKLRDTLLPKLMSGEIDVSKINCDLE